LYHEKPPKPSLKGRALVYLARPPIFIELAQLDHKVSNPRS